MVDIEPTYVTYPIGWTVCNVDTTYICYIFFIDTIVQISSNI